MAGHHSHDSNKNSRVRVLVVLVITFFYMIAEVIGGFFSGSLSLLSDAGHMFADVAALSISLFAVVVAARPPDNKATYGYYRAEILAALLNGVVLVLVALLIMKEAFMRIGQPAEIEAVPMILIALGGLIINLVGLWFLSKDKDKNLNIRGAWLHVFSDTLGSIGVVICGLLILLFNITMADAIVSMIIAALISYSAIKLILESVNVLMEHTPAHIDSNEVQFQISKIDGVNRVHDLHIWSITSGRDALSAHVVAKEGVNYDELLIAIKELLCSRFHIEHTTIQIEKICDAKSIACGKK